MRSSGNWCLRLLQLPFVALHTIERAMRSERLTVRGQPFYVDRDVSDAGELIEKVREAMHLLQKYRPKSIERLQSDVSAIRVSSTVWAAFRPTTRECLLGQKLLRETDTAVVASYLVHELTHARLSRSAPRTNAESLMREEHRCYREQIEFLHALSEDGWRNADLWAAATEQRLQRRLRT